MTGTAGRDDSVRSQATEVAAGWSAPGAPASWGLTAAVFARLAEDEDLLTMAAAIPPSRLPALLFCAAACRLVAEHRPTGLVDYFPTVGAPQPPLDERFGPAFSGFCLDHRAEMVDLFDRRYQMNEVARSTQVALALGALARRTDTAAVALIDIGSGAGLGLHLDRFGHRLGNGAWLGDRMSPLVLDCHVEGPVPSQPRMPTISTRIGVDLEPIDLADPEEAAWARACIPPEVASLARFDAASELALAHPCPVLRADALEVLPGLLDQVPAHLVPVVVDSYTAVFFSDEERRLLRSQLASHGGKARLAWVSLDPLVPLGTAGCHSVQGLPLSAGLVADYQRSGVFALLGLARFDHGDETGDLLARAHPSGTSLTWLDESGR